MKAGSAKICIFQKMRIKNQRWVSEVRLKKPPHPQLFALRVKVLGSWSLQVGSVKVEIC